MVLADSRGSSGKTIARSCTTATRSRHRRPGQNRWMVVLVLTSRRPVALPDVRSISSNFTSTHQLGASFAYRRVFTDDAEMLRPHNHPFPAHGWRRWKRFRPSTAENSS